MTKERPGHGPSTSPVIRSLKMGGLLGRVGTSVLGNRLLEIGQADDEAARRRADTLVRNARRVVESLGELKGAAMKVGQMLSLQEGLLPREVMETLSLLQKQAPAVPPEVMRLEVEGALGDFDKYFSWMDDEAFAAASIGQVHRARLRDGREVAVKIQYPLIDRIVKADLKNLKVLLGSLFGLFADMDFEPLWEEIRDRLLEELDYTVEAGNMVRLAELYGDCPEVVIPEVVPEATRKNVLTMEFVGGLGSDEVFSDDCTQDQRDRWGRVLLEFLFRGLFRHRWLHADPNLANFSFLEDGRMVVYDFGCVKEVPESMARGYASLIAAVLAGRAEEVPPILQGMGIHTADGDVMPVEIADAYALVLGRIAREGPPYTFGEDDFFDEMMTLGRRYWSEAASMVFPGDVIFVNRTFGGHLGNLSRLRATGPWREVIEKYSAEALSGA